MGHLINPTAFRVGWSQQWVDDFFLEFRFYPELLHRLLRFRYFLNCFFQSTTHSQNYFDDYLVSHFSFQLTSKGFTLSIFYYSSRMDSCWYKFFEKLTQKSFGLRFFPKKREEPPSFSAWDRKCLSLLFILYHYSVNGVLDQPYKYRLPFFKAFQNSFQASDFSFFYSQGQRFRFTSLSPSEQECFILLFLLRAFTLQQTGRLSSVSKGTGLRLVNYEFVAQNFFRLIFLQQITKPYFHLFNLWVKFLGVNFFLKQPLIVFFFQLSNDQVSAKFLARFLAIRFSQGFSVRSVITPIRKDLRLAKKFARKSHYKMRSFSQKVQASRETHYSLLTKLILFSSSFSKRSLSSMASFWSFDHFFLSFHSLASQPAEVPPSFITKKLSYRSWSVNASGEKIYGPRRKKILLKPTPEFSLFLRQRRASLKTMYKFLRLFFEKRFFYSFSLRFSNEAKKLFFFAQNSMAFFFELFNEYYLNYETSRRSISYETLSTFRGLSSASLLFLSGAALLDFLKFSLKNQVISRNMDSQLQIKRRNFRSLKIPALGLQGFRIRLHGRFTRKQIASSYHFQEGSLPLSSLDASIDYGFTTVPLRNSAIGIKVWLYRTGALSPYEYAFTFF